MPVNLINGNHEHSITQYNRNKLLWDYAGTDGLKTGYIDESGYNMAVTADRDGMRLIAVVLGVRPTAQFSGPKLRALETEELLSYGFSQFTKISPNAPSAIPVTVWKGKAHAVRIAPSTPPVLVIPKDEVNELKGVMEQKKEVIAPISQGQILGHIVYSVRNKVVATFPLKAEAAVPEGGFFRRLIDSVELFFLRLFGKTTV
jgi:D-alanyl-D-alanine carboxypeptidase (penicillin-binding protein 5/6)